MDPKDPIKKNGNETTTYRVEARLSPDGKTLTGNFLETVRAPNGGYDIGYSFKVSK